MIFKSQNYRKGWVQTPAKALRVKSLHCWDPWAPLVRRAAFPKGATPAGEMETWLGMRRDLRVCQYPRTRSCILIMLGKRDAKFCQLVRYELLRQAGVWLCLDQSRVWSPSPSVFVKSHFFPTHQTTWTFYMSAPPQLPALFLKMGSPQESWGLWHQVEAANKDKKLVWN